MNVAATVTLTLALATLANGAPSGEASSAPRLRAVSQESILMPSGNMEPTIKFREPLVVDRDAFRRGLPAYTDIIGYDVPQHIPLPPAKPDPSNGTVLYIMRVVGLPGDRISIKAGRLHRNGEPVDEPYANYTQHEDTARMSTIELRVPEGHLYVLGDNRGNSNDSRFTGPIPLSTVRGLVRKQSGTTPLKT